MDLHIGLDYLCYARSRSLASKTEDHWHHKEAYARRVELRQLRYLVVTDDEGNVGTGCGTAVREPTRPFVCAKNLELIIF